ncbi:reverse transcriptase domain-containing protein [Tanacetum coccineum]
MLRTMIKVHDQQAKTKAMPRRLAYANSDEEAPASQKTPSKSKELTHLRRSRSLEGRSVTKEKTRRERSKSRGKMSGHQETSSDSEYEEGSEDTYEDLNSPYKKPKPNPFTQRITRFKYHQRAKLPRNSRVYKGNKDPEDHLNIFSATAEQEEWPMPVWCKMFCQTLGGAARNWFDDLDPKSVDIFEELSQKFLGEFSQQKRYAKDPTKIHGIKKRQNEGLQAFMDWFKSESSHIKPVPSVLWLSLEDKSPWVLQKWSVLLSGTRGISIWHGPDRGHNTNDCYQLKKQIEEVVALGKLAHLVKDICRNNHRNGSQGRNNIKVINMIRRGVNCKRPFERERKIEDHQVQRILVDGGSSSEIMYEHCFINLSINIRSRLRRCRAPLIGFSGETYHPLGVLDLQVTMGRHEGTKRQVEKLCGNTDSWKGYKVHGRRYSGVNVKSKCPG